jgi:hypothetical protein
MLDRRRAVRAALAAAAAAIAGRAARAAVRGRRIPEEYERFFPFLVDLEGWSGDAPHGLDLEVPGADVLSAAREYRRGAARLNVEVVAGPTAQGVTAATAANVNIEAGDTRMRTATIDGLAVARSFTAHDRTGVIMVALGANAMFSVVFDGVGEDEALELAQRFDWKAIRAAVPK